MNPLRPLTLSLLIGKGRDRCYVVACLAANVGRDMLTIFSRDPVRRTARTGRRNYLVKQVLNHALVATGNTFSQSSFSAFQLLFFFSSFLKPMRRASTRVPAHAPAGRKWKVFN